MAVLAIGAAAVWYLDTPKARTYSSSDLPTLEQALSTVPASDVPGVDPPGLPRPAGAVRSFEQVRGGSTLVVYSEMAPLARVIAELRQALPAAGWTKQGSDGTVPSTPQSWVALYSRDRAVANVSVTTARGVTAATYIVQVGS